MIRHFRNKTHRDRHFEAAGEGLRLAPKQRNTEDEKEPIKAAQKDVDACWTLKIGDKVTHNSRLENTRPLARTLQFLSTIAI
jgi:hypothetical protein